MTLIPRLKLKSTSKYVRKDSSKLRGVSTAISEYLNHIIVLTKNETIYEYLDANFLQTEKNHRSCLRINGVVKVQGGFHLSPKIIIIIIIKIGANAANSIGTKPQNYKM